MFTSSLLSQYCATPPAWLIPDLLPEGTLVLLEGPASIGKSLLAAALAGYVHQHTAAPASPRQPVLWLSGHQRTTLQANYLLAHQIDPERQLIHNLHVRTLEEECDEAGIAMCSWLDEALQTHQPRLIIIDSLEQVFPFLSSFELSNQQHFLTSLEQLADEAKVTIVMLHEPHTATSLPALVTAAHRRLQLSWHPVHKSSRLLTITKCEQGHIGTQFQIDINCTGQASWQQLKDDARLPAVTQLTRTLSLRSRRGPASCVHEIISKVSQLVTQPVLVREVKALLLQEGYSKHSIRTALSAAPIKTVKEGDDWWYHLPSPSCGASETPQLDKTTRCPGDKGGGLVPSPLEGEG